MSLEYIDGLIQYYQMTRQIGHTQLMIEGLAHYQGHALVIAHQREYADQIVRRVMAINPQAKLYPRGIGNPNSLRGCSGPLAIDNSALIKLFLDCGRYIGTLERKITELEQWKREHPINGTPLVQPRAEKPPRYIFPLDPEFHKCEKPDCDRLVKQGVLYCCHGCTLAAEGKYEIHPTGPLGHSTECNEREAQRRQTEETP